MEYIATVPGVECCFLILEAVSEMGRWSSFTRQSGSVYLATLDDKKDPTKGTSPHGIKDMVLYRTCHGHLSLDVDNAARHHELLPTTTNH